VVDAPHLRRFWNTGDPALAQQALAPDFIDRTLPPGRAGVNGPLQASAFRTAVPDLKAEATHIVPNGDQVSVRLHFTGHFTGQFGEVQGQGQAIDFQAFDLYHVVDGRIAENWHLEDNLTLLQQMGLMSGPQSAPAKRNELRDARRLVAVAVIEQVQRRCR
jgi:hypothetical protein